MLNNKEVKEGLLTALARNPSTPVRQAAFQALSHLNAVEPYFKHLVDLRGENISQRLQAIDLLVSENVQNSHVEKALLFNLKNDSNPEVLQAVTSALTQLNCDTDDIKRTLFDRLKNDWQSEVRQATASALAQLNCNTDARLISSALQLS